MFHFEDIRGVVAPNTLMPGVDIRYPQHQYNAFIIKFRTGSAGEISGAIPGTNVIGSINFSFSPQENRGEVASRFAVLSTKPCDFDYAKADQGDACYLKIGSFGNVTAQVLNGGEAAPGKCGIQPNAVYYLSTRWEDIGTPSFKPSRSLTSCAPGYTNQVGINYCGTSLAIQ
jgi:hypothetical protein